MNKLYKSFIAFAASLAMLGAHAQVTPQVGPGGRPLTFTPHGVLIGQGTANVVPTSAGTSGQCLLSGGASADPSWGSCSGGSSGTVTSVSVVSANGLVGTVATPTTTPAITLSTSVTGLLKGNGTAISAATSGTDYSAGTSGLASGIVKSTTGTGALSIATSGTDYAPATLGSSILYGNGSGGFSNVTIGTGLSFSGGTLTNTGATGVSVINGHISGFALSNDGTTPNSVLDVAVGWASDSANAVMINGGSAFTKSTTGAWAAGTGNKGMGNGLTIAASTWYHVFAIINGGNYDVYFDTSITAANKPASTTAFRYIGSFLTNATAQIVPFKQIGQTFYWQAQRSDLVSGAATTPTLVTMSTPPNVTTFPIVEYHCNNSGTFWSPQMGSSAPGQNICNNVLVGVNNMFATNTSSQIYYQVGAGNSLSLYTDGYINPYVAPNQ
jgi:hypothetical protein